MAHAQGICDGSSKFFWDSEVTIEAKGSICFMTDAELFHQETKSLGGRLCRERLPVGSQRAHRHVLEKAERFIVTAKGFFPTLPSIHVDFVHSGEVNAIAFASNGRYFIGLTTGILFLLRMVIGRMLSDRQLFKTVGIADDETCDQEPLPEYHPNADEMSVKVKLGKPKNYVRRVFAQYIQDQALMFLIGHELAHVSRGHVDYLRTIRGLQFTSEIGWSGSALEEAEERQCLEQDADIRSITSRIHSMQLTSASGIAPPWKSPFTGPGQFMYDWSVSFNILFRLFGDVRFVPQTLSVSNHPPLPLRRAMCELAAVSMIQTDWDPTLADTARRAISLGRWDVEQAFATILGETVSVEGIRAAFSKEGFEYAVSLEKYWNAKLVEELRQFSHEELHSY